MKYPILLDRVEYREKEGVLVFSFRGLFKSENDKYMLADLVIAPHHIPQSDFDEIKDFFVDSWKEIKKAIANCYRKTGKGE